MQPLALLGGPKAVTRPFASWPVWDKSDEKALLGALRSGKWWMYGYGEAELGSGKKGKKERSQVEQFEEEFAALHRVPHAIAVSSGSMALDICMRAIGLQPGDEVITTPYTFIATSACILNAGALPVYVDIDPETYNIDPRRIEEAITGRTRAILPVHFSGELADMEAIGDIAARRNLKVIEDAAQSPGVCLQGNRYAGSFGEAGIFSLQASKCLNSGEGGVVLTRSREFAELAWSLRHYGREKKGLWYEHFRLGWNGRMTEFAGALLRAQLRKLPAQNARRMKNVDYFYKGLREFEGLSPARLHPKAARRSHYLVMLRYDARAWDGLPRARFLEALNAEGVPAGGGYSFLNFENPLFASLDFTSPRSIYMAGRLKPVDYAGCAERCPNAMRACREEAVWIMHPPFNGSPRDVDMILEAIRKVREHRGRLLRG